MSSVTARSDDVFLRQIVESTALPVSLGQPMVTVCPQEKSCHVEWSMRLIPTSKVSNSRCDAAMVKLAGRIDESASRCRRLRHGPDNVFLRQGVESNALLSLSASRW